MNSAAVNLNTTTPNTYDLLLKQLQCFSDSRSMCEYYVLHLARLKHVNFNRVWSILQNNLSPIKIPDRSIFHLSELCRVDFIAICKLHLKSLGDVRIAFTFLSLVLNRL